MKNVNCSYFQHVQALVTCELRRLYILMFKTKILLHCNNTLFGYNAKIKSDENFLSTACDRY